jgi:hypothetical protein
MAWQNPKTDWTTNPKSPMAADFNRIEGNTAFLLSEIETKKGSLVSAINQKANYVTIESSYADMANAINIINQNPRVASGITTQAYVPPVYTRPNLVDPQYDLEERARSVSISVTNLSFKPSKLFARGRVKARIPNGEVSGTQWETWIDYNWGIVANTIANPTTKGVYTRTYGGLEGTAGITPSIEFLSNGFKLTLTAADVDDVDPEFMIYKNTNDNIYWFVEE